MKIDTIHASIHVDYKDFEYTIKYTINKHGNVSKAAIYRLYNNGTPLTKKEKDEAKHIGLRKLAEFMQQFVGKQNEL